MNQKTKYIILIVIVIISISVIFAREIPQVNGPDQVNSPETQREILCVEYTDDNICKRGVDPELWTLVDHSSKFGVVYFCQDAGSSAIGDRCFYIFTNQINDIIKDKINKAFGVQ